jgi:hypothetical protein
MIGKDGSEVATWRSAAGSKVVVNCLRRDEYVDKAYLSELMVSVHSLSMYSLSYK